jgi:hypothetical protein
MRSTLWKVTVLIILHTVTVSPVFAQGIHGFLNLRGSQTDEFEDGKKRSRSTTYNQNYFLSYFKSLTSALSFSLNVRTSLQDSRTSVPDSETSSSHSRTIQPGMQFSLSNPMYSLALGYHRTERWPTAQLKNEKRITNENLLSRFHLSPTGLPSLSLGVNRGKDFDHLSVSKRDTTVTSYTINSDYVLPSEALGFSYNVSYARSIVETPLNTISDESINDGFSNSYQLSYGRRFLGTISTSVSYQGNYSWSQQQLFVNQAGSIILKRPSLGGLYALGTLLKPDVEVLDSIGWKALVDGTLKNSAGIDLAEKKFHNIGIWTSQEKPVDRLYIYVNQDVTNDIDLADRLNWEVFWSNFNQPGTWKEVSVKGVVVTEFDSEDDIFRYEIELAAPQSASYFKAINLETVNILGISKVLITEIEVHGTDEVKETGKISDDSDQFSQGFAINANTPLLKTLNVSMHFSIDRFDQNPDSIPNSFTGIFKNMFTKLEHEEDKDLKINVSRSYGVNTSWEAHKHITTNLSYSRGEFFDNQNTVDSSSDSYNLSFSSDPLPTLTTHLSLSRTEGSGFGEKISASNTIVFSVDAKLYEYINMTTDMAYLKSESFATDTESTAYSLNGSIDAVFTRKLFASLIYNFQWISEETETRSSSDGIMKINYRPGRYIDLTGIFSISSDAEGNETTSEGIFIGWIPLPKIRLNLSYQHVDTTPDSSRSDSFNGSGTWKITEFMDANFSYSYNQRKQEKERSSQSISANLNCRF